MIDKVKPENCTLCGSCINTCPTQAISYTKEYLDFLYPAIDHTCCIDCNACEKVCPVCFDRERELTEGYPKAYIGRNKDKDIRLRSTSGGIFVALADYILGQGGYVCGAVMDETFHVKHILSNQMEMVRKMMGSKYVQSDTRNVYCKIRDVLNNGQKVLFSGCPCQIAGVREFLKKDYDNLILVEIICHGVPGDKMLQGYISLHEKIAKSKIQDIEFRNKNKGWHSSAVKITYFNGRTYLEPITVDAYMYGFLGGITLKESCYHCPFKSYRSGSDMILGDYWGAEVEFPQKDDNTGLSAIIITTPKGETLLHNLSIEFWSSNVDTIIAYNKNIMEATCVNPDRKNFYESVKIRGYEESIREYLWEGHLQRAKRYFLRIARYIKYKLYGKGRPLY